MLIMPGLIIPPLPEKNILAKVFCLVVEDFVGWNK